MNPVEDHAENSSVAVMFLHNFCGDEPVSQCPDFIIKCVLEAIIPEIFKNVECIAAETTVEFLKEQFIDGYKQA